MAHIHITFEDMNIYVSVCVLSIVQTEVPTDAFQLTFIGSRIFPAPGLQSIQTNQTEMYLYL